MTDGDLVLNESRPIATYIAEKYAGAGKDHLYPKADVKARALIDNWLYFDMGVFYRAFQDLTVS